jgi:hypothetical protein
LNSLIFHSLLDFVHSRLKDLLPLLLQSTIALVREKIVVLTLVLSLFSLAFQVLLHLSLPVQIVRLLELCARLLTIEEVPVD